MPEASAEHLQQIYHAALAAVAGRPCTCEALTARPPAGPVSLIAIGKAAASMAQGAVDALGAQVQRGLVISKYGHGEPLAGMQTIEAGHPLPDANSLRAGQALLAFIAQTPLEQTLLFLLSGGTSALVEVLPEGLGLEELRRVNQWLLGRGLAIKDMNRVRRGLSCIKGGRLARRLAGRSALCLMISDVPGDQPHVIGSGLLVPAPEHALPQLPGWLADFLNRAPEAPTAGDACFAGVETQIIANLDQALAAAARQASTLGYPVQRHGEFLAGEAETAGRRIARQLLAGDDGIHLWGGETSVSLPASPGRGGRNQHLALAAAAELAGHPGVWLLAAGTDGSDGPGEDAGALVDGGTRARGEARGLSLDQALRAADSGRLLAASGDLLRTGPTGTNVMDLIVGLKNSQYF